MKIRKVEVKKKSFLGLIFHLMYDSPDFVKFLYRFMYYIGCLAVTFAFTMSILAKAWIFTVLFGIMLFGVPMIPFIKKTYSPGALARAYTFYKLDKAGVYDNSSFMSEFSLYLMKMGVNKNGNDTRKV